MKKLTSLFIFLAITGIVLAQNSAVTNAILFLKDQDYAKAKEAIDQASKDDATSAEAKTWYHLGDIYEAIAENAPELAENPMEVAYNAYAKAIDIDGETGDYGKLASGKLSGLWGKTVNKAIAEQKGGNIESALVLYELAQQMKPEDSTAYLNAAYAAEKITDYKRAAGYYDALLGTGYSSPVVYKDLVTIYAEHIKDTTKALAYAEKGFSKYKTNGPLGEKIADLYMATGMYQKAVTVVEGLVGKYPNEASFSLRLAMLYEALGVMDRAEKYYLQTLKNNADDPIATFNLALIYYNKGHDVREGVEYKIHYDAEEQKIVDASNSYFSKSLDLFEKSYAQDPDEGVKQVIDELKETLGK